MSLVEILFPVAIVLVIVFFIALAIGAENHSNHSRDLDAEARRNEEELKMYFEKREKGNV